MAELTIQIPDELAQRLEPLHNRLPELLWQLLEVANLSTISQPKVATEITEIPAVYQEVLDFLIKRPTPEEIIAFKVSSQAQYRLEELLEKNRSATLNHIESAELDIYEQLEHMMILLKARAFKRD
jgi:predicted transcriptional regulator